MNLLTGTMAINICDIFIDLWNDSVKDLREIHLKSGSAMVNGIIIAGLSYFLV